MKVMLLLLLLLLIRVASAAPSPAGESIFDTMQKPTAFTRYTPEPDVTKELGKLQEFLKGQVRHPLTQGKCAPSIYQCYQREFFEHFVLAKPVEYRLVAELPKEACRFIPVENLAPGAPPLSAGCTTGSITYLLRQVFTKLSPQGKALLLVHERLHSFAPDESYQIKVELVAAFDVLLNRLFPAIEQRSLGFRLTSEEQEKLGKLQTRLTQISRQPPPVAYRLSEHGGLLLGSTVLKGENVRALPGAIIRDSVVSGKDITVLKSYLEGDVEGERIWLEGSSLSNSFRVNQMNLGIEVDVRNPPPSHTPRYGEQERLKGWDGKILQGHEITIVSSSLYAHLDTLTWLKGDRIQIRDSVAENTLITGRDITIEDKSRLFCYGIDASDLTITRSRLVGGYSTAFNSQCPIQVRYSHISGRNLRVTRSVFLSLETEGTVSLNGNEIDVSDSILVATQVGGNRIELSDVKLGESERELNELATELRILANDIQLTHLRLKPEKPFTQSYRYQNAQRVEVRPGTRFNGSAPLTVRTKEMILDSGGLR